MRRVPKVKQDSNRQEEEKSPNLSNISIDIRAGEMAGGIVTRVVVLNCPILGWYGGGVVQYLTVKSICVGM